MEHRRFLAHPEAHRRFVGSNVFVRVGGAAAIDALIDGLTTGSKPTPRCALFSAVISRMAATGKSVFSPSGWVVIATTAIALIFR